MNWSVVVNALALAGPDVEHWPAERRRIVQLEGTQKVAPPRPPRSGPRKAEPVFDDDDVVEAVRNGTATGPTSLAALFGISPSTAHRRLTRLAHAGRVSRAGWGRWESVPQA